MDGVKVLRAIGGAGTGKTRLMISTAEKALARPEVAGDPFAIGFSSFTRVARGEAAKRAAAAWGMQQAELERDGWFRTCHSVAYRQLGVSRGEVLGGGKADDKWVSEALGSDVAYSMEEDGGYGIYTGDRVAAAALNYWSLARSMVVPLREVAEAAYEWEADAPSADEVIRRIEMYETAKRLDGRLDFTDLLSRFVGVRHSASGGPEHVTPEGRVPDKVVGWIFDEAQDASRLLDMACRRLVSGDACKWAWLVGDPFQCQPAGTQVMTASGFKPIESLDDTDSIIAYNSSDGRFYGHHKRVPFQRASRVVDSGELIEITLADGTKHVSTDNHKWLVRTHRGDYWATYLMRKGWKWRVGTVKMFSKHGNRKSLDKNGEFRLNNRFNQEQADEAWILAVFKSDREARLHEQIVSFKFGIPQVTFRPPCGCKNNLDQDFLDRVFDAVGDLEEVACECLTWHGLRRQFPYRRKSDRCKNGRHASRFLEACNILPGITVLPRVNDNAFAGLRCGRKKGVFRKRQADDARRLRSRVTWVPVVSARRLDAGTPTTVYSLNVEKHHTYVTENRYITGNCIYGWAGAASEYFMGWPVDRQEVMPKSYRCAAAILQLGEDVLQRLHKGYWNRGIAPADHDGEVIESSNYEDDLSDLTPDSETLVLARTNRNVGRIASILDDCGVPYRRIKSKEGAHNADIGMAGLWKLQHGQHATREEWTQAIGLLPSQTIRREAGVEHKETLLARGSKAQWGRGVAEQYDLLFPEDLPAVGATEHLRSVIADGRWCELVDGGIRWHRAATKFGLEVVANPKIRIGTIHAAKGMEADNVIVLSSVGRRIRDGEENSDERHDEERRIEYVAVTRARRRLVLAHDPREKYRMDLPL